MSKQKPSTACVDATAANDAKLLAEYEVVRAEFPKISFDALCRKLHCASGRLRRAASVAGVALTAQPIGASMDDARELADRYVKRGIAMITKAAPALGVSRYALHAALVRTHTPRLPQAAVAPPQADPVAVEYVRNGVWDAIPAGHPLSWRVINAGTSLDGVPFA